MTTGPIRTLAVITARGGSKGLPGKNILPLAGKPLIAWTIEAALAARGIDQVILSSDDAAIIEVARTYGCAVPFVRPAALAADDTPTLPVLHHAMDAAAAVQKAENSPPWTHVVLLQPTSPLRTAADIDAALAQCVAALAPACVSVSALDKPLQWLYKRRADGRLMPAVEGLEPLTRRQDAELVVVPNGALYVAQWAWIRSRNSFISDDTLGYVMPAERAVDIDTLLDFRLAELLLAQAGLEGA